MSRLVPFLLVVLALQATLPVASAQGATSVDLTLPNLPAPVPPGTAQRFNVTVRYQWEGGASPQPTTVRLDVLDQPSWLNSTFDPASLTFDPTRTGQVLGGVATRFVNLTVAVAADAPAFDEGVASYQVTAEPSGGFAGASKESQLDVTAGFSGEVNVTLPEGGTVRAPGGFVTKVPVRLENRGNGPLFVDIRIARLPAEALIDAPETITLGTTPDERVVTAYLDVRVPWKVSESGPVEIEVVPTHATRGTAATIQEAGFELEGRSAIPVPGAGVVPLLAVFVALAVLRRRA